jgi:hypothetical protein
MVYGPKYVATIAFLRREKPLRYFDLLRKDVEPSESSLWV